MILHLVHLLLHQQTIIYTGNWEVPKIAISPFFFLLSPSDGITRQRTDFLVRFLTVTFIKRQVCDFLPKFKKFRVKQTLPYTYALYEPHSLCNLIITHASTTPYTKLPSINEKWNSYRTEELSSTLPLSFAIAVNQNNSSENCIQVVYDRYLQPPYK